MILRCSQCGHENPGDSIFCSSCGNSFSENKELTLLGGVKYVGEFKDGLPNGQGTATYPTGAKYVGEYKGGRKSGQGTYTWPDGKKYVGEFKDGDRHGQGTMTLPDGTIQKGLWKDDVFVD